MCDPVSIAIAVGSQLASSALQSQAQKKVSKARSGVVQRNIADQKKYRQASQQALETSQTSASRPAMETAATEAEAERGAKYQAGITGGELLPGQGDTSSAVKQAIVGALTTGEGRSREEARNKAVLDAYGDVLFGRDVTMGRSGQQIQQQADFGRGRQSVMPLELEAANRAGDKLAGMAGLVSGLGSLGSAAYGAGVFNPATEASRMGRFGGGYGTYGNLGRVDWKPV